MRGLIAGNSLEMPGTGGETDRQILAAVQRRQRSSDELLDERVSAHRCVLFPMTRRPPSGTRRAATWTERHEFARPPCRGERAVLLKNEGGILPLKENARVAVIGDFARTPRYQGAGSSHIEPTKLECGLDALRAEGVNVIRLRAGLQAPRRQRVSRLHKPRLRAVHESRTSVLVWLGLDEGSEAEGVDRRHMRIRRKSDTSFCAR